MAVNGNLEDVSVHCPPSKESGGGGWNPHYHLKGHVRRVLEDATEGVKRGPKSRRPFETAVYSGFIFPSVGRGALLLDSIQSAIECTPSSMHKIASRASEEYDLGTIYVGDTAIIGGNDVPPIYFSVPSVARLAMDKDGLRGRDNLSLRFGKAAAQLMELGG